MAQRSKCGVLFWMRLPLTLAALTVLAGCGGGNLYGSSSGSTTSPTATPTTTVATADDMPIHVSTVTVQGASKSVLTTNQGLTLYYRTDDVANNPVCGVGCLDTWPLAGAPNGATSSATLSGKLTVVLNGGQHQAEYNGWPLYRYSGDQNPGDANGNGIQGIWFVATPSLPQNTNGSSGGNPYYP